MLRVSMLVVLCFALALASDAIGQAGAIPSDDVPEGLTATDWANILAAHQGLSATERAGNGSILKLSKSSVVQQAYVKASNTGKDDWFGHSVAVSENTVVVGVYQEPARRLSLRALSL